MSAARSGGRRGGPRCRRRGDHGPDRGSCGGGTGRSRGRDAVVGIGSARHLEGLARQGRDHQRRLVLRDGDGAAARRERTEGGGRGRETHRESRRRHRARDGHIEGHGACGGLRGRGTVGIDGTGGQTIEAAVAEPGRGRHQTGGERDLGLIARNLELLARREARGRDRGRGGDAVEHEITHRAVRAVELVGAGQRRRRRRCARLSGGGDHRREREPRRGLVRESRRQGVIRIGRTLQVDQSTRAIVEGDLGFRTRAHGDVAARRREGADSGGRRGDVEGHARRRDGIGDGHVEGQGSGRDRSRCRSGGLDRARLGAGERRKAHCFGLLHDGGGDLCLGLQSGQVELLAGSGARRGKRACHDHVVEDEVSYRGIGTEDLIGRGVGEGGGRYGLRNDARHQGGSDDECERADNAESGGRGLKASHFAPLCPPAGRPGPSVGDGRVFTCNVSSRRPCTHPQD